MKKTKPLYDKAAPISSKTEDIAAGTTTQSVVGAGDNPAGTVVVDKRRRKDKPPRILKRFSKFIE
jgi:hypothetical protein